MAGLTGNPFAELLDDAAIFPPGNTPLDQAVPAHMDRVGTPLGTFAGPLVLPLSALADAASFVRLRGGGPMRTAVILPNVDVDRLIASLPSVSDALSVEAVEFAPVSAPNPRDRISAASKLADRWRVSVELTTAEVNDPALRAMKSARVTVKYRTGGQAANAFPTSTDLAAVIGRVVQKSVPFKLTAGLHQPVRHTDPVTGFEHHGFLNIALATASAQDGASTDQMSHLLEMRDSAEIAERIAATPVPWRDSFTSFGTCSIIEPVQGLEQLGLWHDRMGSEENT